MKQIMPIFPLNTDQWTMYLDNVHATFVENMDGSYDVTLEINSNKFLINVEKITNHIEHLNIITTKGFVELSNKIILTIKKLIEYFRPKRN